jgi:hypothetical protein
MHTPISKQTKVELLAALRERYRQAAKSEKSRVLDEFVAMAGCHRKHAIRLLTATDSSAAQAAAVDRRTYDEAVRQALVILWEAADRICGKRLKAVLPDLITSLEQHGHLALDRAVKEKLRSERDRLDPLELLHRIREAPEASRSVTFRDEATRWGRLVVGIHLGSGVDHAAAMSSNSERFRRKWSRPGD